MKGKTKISEYNHLTLEKKVQKQWDANKIYKTETIKTGKSQKKPCYVLDMFPYPSGQGLHVGHPRGYIGSDVYARFKRMQGYNVLHPMGFDSFGLPAEQYAIQTGKHPSIITDQSIKIFKKQLEGIGFSYDWSREVQTSDPEYYKWTQVIFLKIYNSFYDTKKEKARPIDELVTVFEKEGNTKANEYTTHSDVQLFSKNDWQNFSPKERQDVLMKYRLAYEGYAEVNWCKELGTVLANDEVLEKDGKLVSERGDFPVEKKSMRQWFMRISVYGDRLLSGLDLVDFPDSTKEIQKNWIGKSEGSEIEFKIVVNTNPTLTLPKGEGIDPGYITTNAQEYEELHKKALEMRKNPTEAEKKLWNDLKDNKTGFHFRRQHIIDHFIVDFLCLEKKLIIEVDGEVHDVQQERDSDRQNILEQLGYTVIRFSNKKVLGDIKKVIEKIIAELNKQDGSKVLSFGEDLGGVCIKIFTTRADTLFGVTYVVLAPEHALVKELIGLCKNKQEVEKYLEGVRNKTQEERTDSKEKTGVCLEGIYATNPANGEQVPVWVGDYVLASYGTGAVMAVPAHDERDFEFAKKYNLPMKQVVMQEVGLTRANEIYRRGVNCVIFDPNSQKYACAKWSHGQRTWFGGGVDEEEDVKTSALRELEEESGFINIQHVEHFGTIRTHFINVAKKLNRVADIDNFLFILKDLSLGKIAKMEHETFETDWCDALDLINEWSQDKNLGAEHSIFFLKDAVKMAVNLGYDTKNKNFLENDFNSKYGILVNSNQFDGLTSEEAKKEITQFVGGKLVTKYKMRDAIFARQRYWGEPIPLIHDKKTGLIKEVPLSKLPLKLPNVKSYKPTGTGDSPLAGVKSWTDAGYETNTMPGWAGSSWYFFRYMDPKNKKALASGDSIKYWKNVDMYVGGAEHATGHLLYSRFWHKVLFDLGIAKTEEPFKVLRHQGMIGGADGRKMSKRWGNVVNPDDVVKTYGADTLRVFEMFLGPFGAHLPWSEDGIIGSRRFVERVWRLGQKILDESALSPSQEREHIRVLHKTIKKVTEDIESFNHNTAVSAMMICLNEMEKLVSSGEKVHVEDFKLFLQILAPFASHIADELWQSFGEKKSIHLSLWPKYNPKLIIDTEITLGVQVNGKVRGEVTIAKDADQKTIEALVAQNENVQKYVTGPIKKFIYIPGKIISIVV